MTTEHAPQQDPLAVFHGQLNTRARGLERMLPPGVSPQLFLSNAMGYVQRTPALLNADRESLIVAIMETARLGLMPHSGAVPGVHIVPMWNGRRRCNVATPIVDYRALIDLCVRAGVLQWADAQPVFAEDSFTLELGMEPKLVHRVDHTKTRAERGELVGCYAVGKLQSGAPAPPCFMNAGDLEAHALRYATDKAGKLTGKWAGSEDERLPMQLKTVVRRFVNMLPRSAVKADQLGSALAMNERGEHGLGPGDTWAALGAGATQGQQATEQQGAASMAERMRSDAAARARVIEQGQDDDQGADDGGAPLNDEPEAPAEKRATTPVPTVDEAADTVLPSGEYAGRKVHDVAVSGDVGLLYLDRLARRPDTTAALRAALAVYLGQEHVAELVARAAGNP